MTQTNSPKKAAGDQNAEYLHIPGQVTREWVEQHSRLLSRPPSSGLKLDFSATDHIDTAGASFFRILKEKMGSELIFVHMSSSIASLLESSHRIKKDTPDSRRSRFSFNTMRKQITGTVTNALFILEEMLYWATIGLRRKRDFRKGIFAEQLYMLGYRAIGIVVLLSFLIGVVVSLQSALFLKEYGAGIYLASMIGWTMVREFGPLITAIIIAGRNGSATTAEIATMQVQEEVDALRAMGLNPVQFIVVPKLYAIVLTMPLLAIIASASGIFGGFLVSLSYLDIGVNLFMTELTKYIYAVDVVMNMVKSMVFGTLIVWVGTFYGFKVRGGAEQVGKETTACVVTGIFVIIVADAIFSFIY